MTNKKSPAPIIVALDGMTKKEALKMAQELKGLVWGFKVNDLLFEGVEIIKKLKKFGKVFADAKLHDIPNTVANSVARLSKAEADLITVHASGGVEMMRAAKKVAGKSKLIAVTVLTSQKSGKSVGQLAKDAQKAGVDGVVCSADELKKVKKLKNLIKVVPGIRPEWYKSKDDQQRIASPRQALENGADFLVIGRPITQSPSPLAALKKILAEVKI
ncbi:MAG: orotidine-5'-phosphate decarboxylase [bacterium]|nr:orotidine-5'-phosphate decarboxylase [bacterium]